MSFGGQQPLPAAGACEVRCKSGPFQVWTSAAVPQWREKSKVLFLQLTSPWRCPGTEQNTCGLLSLPPVSRWLP